MLRDERAVVPIGSFNKHFWRHAVASERGRTRRRHLEFEPEMSGEERQVLEAGAANLRKSDNRT